MVGYGAGAWQMTQLEKVGLRGPRYDDGWEVCAQRPAPENPGSGSNGNGNTNPPMDGSTMNGETPTPGDTNDDGTSTPGNDAPTPDGSNSNNDANDGQNGSNPFAMADDIAETLRTWVFPAHHRQTMPIRHRPTKR